MTKPQVYLANMVGANFRPQECRDICATLEPGQALRLEREPLNMYDENAIKVIYADLADEYHLGYIESKSGLAKEIAPWLDDGWVFDCTIHSLTGDKRTPFLLHLEPTGERNTPDAGASLDEEASD